MTGDSAQVAGCAGLPPIAVPMTVKMPEPMTAPMPSAVSETGPSVFFSACLGQLGLSVISLSMDLVAKICRACVFWRLWWQEAGVRSSLRKMGAWMKRLYAESCARQQKTGEAVASPAELEGYKLQKAFCGLFIASTDRAPTSSPWPCSRRGEWCACPWERPSCALRALPSCALSLSVMLFVFAMCS